MLRSLGPRRPSSRGREGDGRRISWILVFDKGDELMATLTEFAEREQIEVLTFASDIALEDGKPKVHAHVVLGKADGTAHGGHVLDARVWPTLELVLAESPRALARRSDPETGLALIEIGTRQRA